MNETVTSNMMTMSNIEEQFDNEWILLADPIIDERRQVAGGNLLFHSKNRDEVYQAALRFRPEHAAFLYIGPMPDNIAINL